MGIRTYKAKAAGDGTLYNITTDSVDDLLGALYGMGEAVEEDGVYVADKETLEALAREFPGSVEEA